MNRRNFSKLTGAVLAYLPVSSWPLASVAEQEPVFDSADDDSYAIWSMLIPVLRPHAKGYLVPSITNRTDMIDGVFVKPSVPMSPIERVKRGMVIEMDVPSDFLDRFESAAEAFKAEMRQPVQLERRLTLPHPYRLMDRSAMDEYSRLKPPVCVADASHPWHRDRGLEKKYAGFAAPCFFSRVFFDRDRSLGLVYAGTDSGDTTFAFGKDRSGWQPLDWPATTMSFNC